MLKRIKILAFIFLIIIPLNYIKSDPISEEQVQRYATEFLLKEQTNPPRIVSKINNDDKVMPYQALNLTISKIHPIIDNNETVAYIQELEPLGFIIISADDDIKPILGFSFTSKFVVDNISSNPLLDLILADIYKRKTLIEDDNISFLENGFLTQWGPWLQTAWQQTGHWNNKCPYSLPYTPGIRRPVGCVATALAQIVNYWKYPKSMAFSPINDSYLSGSIDIFNDASKYGFPTASELSSSLENISYDDNQDEEAYLCFGLGVKLHMNYGVFGSGANTYSVRNVLLNQLNYGSATAFTGSDIWNSHYTKIIDDIKNGWPVQIAIHKTGELNGHSIVVDGYRESEGYFHLNYGWGDNSPNPICEAWYNIPAMPHYDVVHTVVYGISKYLGWNQYGADAQNTFCSPYTAPIGPEVLQKWRVTCSTEYNFSNIIIGSSSSVYAAVSTDASSGHPFVYVINKSGSILKQIELNRDGNIEFMCQSENGDIFASMENGYIFRINPYQGSAVEIFHEPNEDDIYALKVDEDGWLYATTFYRLYALTNTGTLRWSTPFIVPSGTMFLGGGYIPTIDVSRQHIYVTYYNSTTKHPYLVALNRLNGQIENSPRDFGTVTIPSFRAISLGIDGTLYVRMPGVLYALDPNDLTGTPKWSKSLLFTTTPAVGHDGTLYCPYWEEVGGIWYNKLGAFDPSDGSIKWTVSFQLDPSEEDIFQPYITRNQVVLFTIEHNGSPKTYTLHAYKDNGNGAEEQWQYDTGESGGDYAFGPGRTVFAWGKTGLAQTIYALSDGEVGEPDGAGMNYENNTTPISSSNPNPVDGTMNLDTTSIELHWTCSDPDGHTLKYDIYTCVLGEGEEAAFTLVASKVTGSSFTLHNLRSGTQYLWSVIATDGQAVSEGPIWSFSTKKDTISCCIGFTGNTDCSASEDPDISDITRIIDFLYLSHKPLCCPEEADTDGSGGYPTTDPDISDITRLIDYLYLSHTPLAECP